MYLQSYLSWCLHWDSSYLNVDSEWGGLCNWGRYSIPADTGHYSLSYKIKGHCSLSFKINRVDLHQVINPTIGTWLHLTWHLKAAQNRQCSEVLIPQTSKLMGRELFRMLLWALHITFFLSKILQWVFHVIFSRMLPSVLTVALFLPTSISAVMRIEVASPMAPIKEPMGSQFMLQVIDDVYGCGCCSNICKYLQWIVCCTMC